MEEILRKKWDVIKVITFGKSVFQQKTRRKSQNQDTRKVSKNAEEMTNDA